MWRIRLKIVVDDFNVKEYLRRYMVHEETDRMNWKGHDKWTEDSVLCPKCYCLFVVESDGKYWCDCCKADVYVKAKKLASKD